MLYKVIKNGHAVLGKFDNLRDAEESINKDIKKMIDFQKIPLVFYEFLSNDQTTVKVYQALDDLHFELYLIVQVMYPSWNNKTKGITQIVIIPNNLNLCTFKDLTKSCQIAFRAFKSIFITFYPTHYYLLKLQSF